jgi:ABC-type lipoprotein release transport system permease subunit
MTHSDPTNKSFLETEMCEEMIWQNWREENFDLDQIKRLARTLLFFFFLSPSQHRQAQVHAM